MLEHRLMHLGRPMAVDWSLPKNVYDKMHTKGTCSSKLERIASIFVEERAETPGGDSVAQGERSRLGGREDTRNERI